MRGARERVPPSNSTAPATTPIAHQHTDAAHGTQDGQGGFDGGRVLDRYFVSPLASPPPPPEPSKSLRTTSLTTCCGNHPYNYWSNHRSHPSGLRHEFFLLLGHRVELFQFLRMEDSEMLRSTGEMENTGDKDMEGMEASGLT